MRFAEFYRVINEDLQMEAISLDKDYIGLQVGGKDAYIPLNHKANKILASHSLGGCTGKWCFARHNEDKSHWKTITSGGYVPVYVVSGNKKYAVVVDKHNDIEIFDSEDNPVSGIPGVDTKDILSGKAKYDKARDELTHKEN